MGKSVFLVFILCGLVLPTITFAYDDGEEASGDFSTTARTTVFPTDDEDDLDASGSGEGPTEIIDVISEEITEEPEVTDHINSKRGRKNKDVTEKPVVENPNVEEIKEEVVIIEKVVVVETEEETEPEIVKEESGSLLNSKQFLIAVIVGGCIGLIFTIGVIMLLVYRMRKKDEGSYALDDKNTNFEYTKGINKEYHV